MPAHRDCLSHGATEPQEESGRGSGGSLGLVIPCNNISCTKIRTGSTKCLTRKLPGMRAALGDGGLRKTDAVPRTLTTAQGSEASLWRGTVGKASSQSLSLHAPPGQGDTVGGKGALGYLGGTHPGREQGRQAPFVLCLPGVRPQAHRGKAGCKTEAWDPQTRFQAPLCHLLQRSK